MPRAHRKAFTGKPLQRQNNTPLQPGDLLVARVQYAGCSYHHHFVQVVQRTPTQNWRVKGLAIRSFELSRGDWGSKTQVWPDLTQKPLGSFVLRADGTCGNKMHDFRQYRHYTDDLEIIDNFDNGD